MNINDIQEFYDYRSSKYQNFAYKLKVISISNNLEREVEVYATSLLVAIDNLQDEIGDKFKIIEYIR